MSDHGSIEENVTGNSSEFVRREVSEIQTLTQESVNKRNKGFIAPLTRQLEELTRLVQGMVTTQHPATTPGLILVPLLVQPHISPTTLYTKCRKLEKNQIFKIIA